MKSYKILIFSLLAVFVVSSCGDKLEIEPAQSISGDIAVTSESNIENILIGVYDEAGQDESHGGQLQVIADLLGSDDQLTWGGTFLAPAEIVNKMMLPDNGFVAQLWNNAYEVINQANIVIDNIEIVTSDMDKRSRIEGEARFLRALNYFDLAQHFSSGTMSVPLRFSGILDYSIDLSARRAETELILGQVIADLEEAIRLLPATNSFFADKYSAQALLARVYLYQGNYAAARDAAHDVLENSGHALSTSYAAAFNHDADNEEDIFSFQVTSQTGSNDLITFYASEGNGGRGGDISVTDAYVALFDDANDERSTFFYESPETGGRLTSKYVNQFGNIILIRAAEMHLIRAEGNLEENTETGLSPLDEINALRNRSSAGPLTSVTKADILAERQRELGFEGFFIYDVKRTQGTTAGLSYDDPALVLPIPQGEMDTNSEMVQNPGY